MPRRANPCSLPLKDDLLSIMDRLVAVQGLKSVHRFNGTVKEEDFVRWIVRDSEKRLLEIYLTRKEAVRASKQCGGTFQACSLTESRKLLKAQKNNFEPLPDRREPDQTLSPGSTLNALRSTLPKRIR